MSAGQVKVWVGAGERALARPVVTRGEAACGAEEEGRGRAGGKRKGMLSV